MKVRLMITGGTIDKFYNQSNGELEFDKTHFPEMIKRARIEVDLVTCLLYTSPSPRDLSTSRMPSSA